MFVYLLGLKPLNSSPCIIQECVEQFEYRVVGMTPCSRSCLGGEWFPCKPQREAQTQHKTALRHDVIALVSFPLSLDQNSVIQDFNSMFPSCSQQFFFSKNCNLGKSSHALNETASAQTQLGNSITLTKTIGHLNSIKTIFYAILIY